MHVCWRENICLIYDDSGSMRLSIEERLFPDWILLRLSGFVCAQTEKYFIEELRAGASIQKRVVLDLLGLHELSENASMAICTAWRQLLTECGAGLWIVGSPMQLRRRSAADGFVLSRAEKHEKGAWNDV